MEMEKLPSSVVLMNFLEEFDYENRKSIYQCKFCPVKYSQKNVTKMRKHVQMKCPTSPIACITPITAAASNTGKTKSTSATSVSTSSPSNIQSTDSQTMTADIANIPDATDIFVDLTNSKEQNTTPSTKIPSKVLLSTLPNKEYGVVAKRAMDESCGRSPSPLQVQKRRRMSSTPDIMDKFCVKFDYGIGKATYQCKFCPVKYSYRNATKMRKHVEMKCPGLTNNHMFSLGKSELSPALTASPTPYSTSNGFTNTNTQFRSTANLFFNRKKNTAQNELSEKLARAIFTSRTPPSIVENEAWLDFFRSVRPSLHVPPRKVLLTTFLDKEYNAVKEKVEAKIYEGSCLSLQVSAWTNPSQSVLNFVINTPQPVCATFLECKPENFSSEYIAKEIVTIMEEYRFEKFTGIISDSSSNLTSALKQVKEKYPAIVTTTCFVHSLNLLVADFLNLESVRNITENSISIIENIKKNPPIYRRLKEICEMENTQSRLVLPLRNSWSSFHKCLDNMIQLKPYVQMLATDNEEFIDLNEVFSKQNWSKMKDVILDDNFWEKLQAYVDLISILVDVLAELQTRASKPNIHKIYPLCRKLQKSFAERIMLAPLSDVDRMSIYNRFVEIRDVCSTPVFLTAYKFDTNHDNGLLLVDQEVEITDFINDLSKNMDMSEEEIAQILADFVNYRTKGGIFAKPYLWMMKDKVEPINWWQTVPSELSKIAIRILSIPATSTPVQKSFSHEQGLHKKKKSKLEYIYLNHKLLVSPTRVEPNAQNNMLCLPSMSPGIEESEDDDTDFDEKTYSYIVRESDSWVTVETIYELE